MQYESVEYKDVLLKQKLIFVFFQCDRCLPLYNDKPFHSGDQVHAYNCKPCQCYSHAVSCHYDVTLDPFPNEYDRGGGGICDNCQHNTTGNLQAIT